MMPGSDSIFLSGTTGKLIPMISEPYESEDLLQRLLAGCPDLLAGGQMFPDSPLRWMLVRREFGVPVKLGGGAQFSADHLFLDQHGVPTIVEVKQAANKEIRREIVGQMLDYAANGVRYWPVATLRAVHDATCRAASRDPNEVVAELLNGSGDVEAYWSQVAANLTVGRVRMVFVSDNIPPELRRIVEFLNEQLQRAEVFAVEVRQYIGSGLSALVPRLIGDTVAARDAKKAGGSRTGPGYEALLAAATGSVRVVEAHLDRWANNRGLSTRTTQAGKQYFHATIGFVAHLYPSYESVDIWFGDIIDAGMGADLDRLRGDLGALTQHRLAPKLPSLNTDRLAADWPAAVILFDRYLDLLIAASNFGSTDIPSQAPQ